MKTHIVFLLDETGSMIGCFEQTLSGFNEYIETLRDNSKGNRFTLTKFNSHKTEVVLDGVKLKNVPELSADNYKPDYLTPLYDAIGITIKSAEKVKADDTLFIVMTDGLENASHEYTQETIFKMIKDHSDWKFVFLGADQDAWANSKELGFRKMDTMSYESADTGKTFRKISASTTVYLNSNDKSKDFFDE